MTRPRCITVTGEDGEPIGVARGAGPVTDADLAVLRAFHQLLRDAHEEEAAMTQPDQTPQSAPPGEVDLAAAGVDGWYFVLEQIAKKKAELDEAEKIARGHIEKALGQSVIGTFGGMQVVRWSHTAAPRNFDKKTFTKDHPNLAAKYTKVGKPGRRFELVTPKGGQS